MLTKNVHTVSYNSVTKTFPNQNGNHTSTVLLYQRIWYVHMLEYRNQKGTHHPLYHSFGIGTQHLDYSIASLRQHMIRGVISSSTTTTGSPDINRMVLYKPGVELGARLIGGKLKFISRGHHRTHDTRRQQRIISFKGRISWKAQFIVICHIIGSDYKNSNGNQNFRQPELGSFVQL